MLQSIVEYLRIKLQALNIGTVYGLGELVEQQGQQYPAIYIGSGQYNNLADFDNHVGSFYFRLVAPVSNSPAEGLIGGDDSYQRTYQLRVVAFVPKSVYNTDNNYIDDKIAHNIQAAIQSDDDSLLSTSLKAQGASIEVSSWETNRNNVLGNEIINTLFENIPFEYAFIAVDFTVIITGSPSCFETYGCNDEFIDYLELLRELVCESECADATATATNSEDTNLGTITIESGGTGNIAIADSVISNTQGVLTDLPATEPYTVGNSLVTLTNTLGTVLGTNNLPATVALPLTAPNSTTNVQDQNGNPLGQTTGISGATNTQQVTIPVCPDLDELVDTSTNTEVYDAIVAANKECAIQASLVNRYGEGCLIGKAIIPTLPATNFPSPSGMYWFDNKMYFCSGNNLQIYDAITKDVITIVGGFNIPTRVAANASIIAVANFGTTQVRIMDANSPSTQLALYSVISQPVGTALSPDGSTLYVGSQNGSQIRKYNPLTGATIGSAITGNQTRVDQITMHHGGTEYWCITSNSGSTQQIIRRLISNDSVVGTITLLSVAAAGLARSFSIRDNGNVIVIYDLFKAIEYNTAGTEIRQTFTGGFACAGGIARNQSEECEVHWAAAQNFSQITQWICPS